MSSLSVDSGKLSRKPKFQLLDGERVRQGFLEHGDFLGLQEHLQDLPKVPVVVPSTIARRTVAK